MRLKPACDSVAKPFHRAPAPRCERSSADRLGQPIAVATRIAINANWFQGVSTAHLVGDHVYAVERIDRTTHPPTIVLLNPWGAQGSDSDHPYETRITEDQWNANFLTYSYTTVQP